MPLSLETFYNSGSAIVIDKEWSASQRKVSLKHSVGGRGDWIGLWKIIEIEHSGVFVQGYGSQVTL